MRMAVPAAVQQTLLQLLPVLTPFGLRLPAGWEIAPICRFSACDRLGVPGIRSPEWALGRPRGTQRTWLPSPP